MRNGASEEKVAAALGDYRKSSLFSLRERLALALCERMTYPNKGVRVGFSIRLRSFLGEEERVDRAAIILRKNFRSNFNPFLAVGPRVFCPLPAVKQVAEEAARRFHE